MTEYGSVMETKNGWKALSVVVSETPIPVFDEIAKPFATQVVIVSGTVTSIVLFPDSLRKMKWNRKVVAQDEISSDLNHRVKKSIG